MEARPQSCRGGTEHYTICGLVVKDLADYETRMIEKIASQARRISIHENPFNLFVDKRLCNFFKVVILLVFKIENERRL